MKERITECMIRLGVNEPEKLVHIWRLIIDLIPDQQQLLDMRALLNNSKSEIKLLRQRIDNLTEAMEIVLCDSLTKNEQCRILERALNLDQTLKGK